jgi:hypothetical protein
MTVSREDMALALGELVRERQDLAEQASAVDRALIALMSQPTRSPAARDALRQRAEGIAPRLKEIDAALAARFPQYAALTPPSQASEDDDGLLTASEVAQLEFDADWVILSACNTTAGDDLEAEALSGLARAFFYAGSRAPLASHWYVDSKAAVALVTRAFAEINAQAGVGRAEALRRAMLALVGQGGRLAHPAIWAPFVVVGEGAR